jgi:chemotaxis protein histidine kinase CheA
VLDRLVERRLVERRLISRHEAESGDSATLEVVHEALGRRWPLLHTWLEETRAERELIHDARHDAERWQRAGGPADLLWRGARLDAALSLAGKLGPAQGFIDAAARAQSEQRWRKRATVGLLFGLLGLAVVLVLGYLASSRGQDRARRAYAAAVAAQEQAEDARAQAEAELSRNVSVREETERALERALVEQKAAQAERVQAESARVQAEADRDQNVALRRDAEVARRAAEAERARAETAMREAQAAKQEAEKQSALASTQLREANKQRTYAETATRLHEMARRRMEQIEVAFDRLESQRAGLAKERDALRSKLEICRKGS